ARCGGGGIMGGEGPARDLSDSVDVTLRHPGNLTTQFTGTLSVGPLATTQVGDQPPMTPFSVDTSFFDLDRWIAWAQDNYLLVGGAGLVVVIVIVLIIVAVASRRKPAPPAASLPFEVPPAPPPPPPPRPRPGRG